MRAPSWLLLVPLALAIVGCGTPVDLSQKLEVVDVSTGWWDVGVVDGQNKLVPSVTFKFKNNSDQTLSTLQANVLFKRVGEETEWGSAWVRVVGSDGLPPTATSEARTVNSPKGYTGSEPRAQMMANSQFIDGRVEIFAKYSSTQWQLVADFPVERRLIPK